MSNTEDYAAMLEEAKSISSENIKIPYMPVGIYAQEAEDLYYWSTKDKDQLLAVGLSETVYSELPVCAGALREAQSIWMEDLKTRQEAEEEWAQQSPMAFDFRDMLVHTYRYAYRNDVTLLNNVAAIAQGDDITDMIQDLNDLAVLGRKNPEPLLTVGLTVESFDKAASLSDEMADLRGRANGDKYDGNENKIIRDQMYTLLKRKVDEIRDCGKFVFWKDKARLKGYYSNYNRRN
ncbi:hypothetical protein E9993_14860 [Labilibacter sediminis]|nr:hypothetical protein E9993_14860 [Labilibacter sediminis]